MIICDSKIIYKETIPVKIKPIFDVHYGHQFCDVHAFKQYLAKDYDKHTYFIGGGDLLDSIIVSDKRYRKSMDASEGDDIVDSQIDDMYKMLLPYKDKIIGLGIGNHEDVITRKCGTNPINRLCSMLEVKPLGYSSLIRLRFIKDAGGGGRNIDIRIHHGWGGGSRTRGADITKYERDMGKWDADIYLYGHVHKMQDDLMPRLGLVGFNKIKLIAKPQLLCLCGSFQKSYSDTIDPTYAEVKGFPPVEIGGIVIRINLTRNYYKLSVEY